MIMALVRKAASEVRVRLLVELDGEIEARKGEAGFERSDPSYHAELALRALEVFRETKLPQQASWVISYMRKVPANPADELYCLAMETGGVSLCSEVDLGPSPRGRDAPWD
jgi:hypothetical protein